MNIYLFERIIGVSMLFFQALILFLLGYLLYKKISGKQNTLIENIFGKQGLFFVFIFSLLSLVLSLIFSDYYGVEPCKLCWLQRVCMYPQMLISGLALVHRKHEEALSWLALAWLSLIGFLLASYQSLEQFRVNFLPEAECVTGPDAACSQIHMMEFGYITFPLSSALLFFAIFVLFLLRKR